MGFVATPLQSGRNSGTGALTVSPGTVTAGNLLILVVAADTSPGSGGQMTITPSGSRGTFLQQINKIDTDWNVRVYSVDATSSGDGTYTVTPGDTDAQFHVAMFEFNGNGLADVRGSNSSSGTDNSPTSGAVTAIVNELIFSATLFIGTSVAAAGGYTSVLNNAGPPGLAVETLIATGTSHTATMTGTGLSQWVTVGLSFKYAQPTAPSVLAATAVSSTEIDLTWIDNSNNEANFSLDRADNNTFTTNKVTTTPAANATSAQITGLTASKQYFFRIRAVNGEGNSSFTSTANATTQAPASGGPTALFFELIIG